MWQRDGNASGTRNWNSAKTYCANLNLWWYTDWRLPNIKELASIVDYSSYNQSIDSKFTNTVSDGSWSSTTRSHYTNHAWILNFYNGSYDFNNKTGYNSVRCVR